MGFRTSFPQEQGELDGDFPGDGPAVRAGVRRDRDEPAAQYGSSPDSPLEERRFEPSVPLA